MKREDTSQYCKTQKYKGKPKHLEIYRLIDNGDNYIEIESSC
jgi:hypothetical protein